jgi:hypothetical protein
MKKFAPILPQDGRKEANGVESNGKLSLLECGKPRVVNALHPAHNPLVQGSNPCGPIVCI